MDEAYSALVRIKAEGGPASFSYKNYNLPSRCVTHIQVALFRAGLTCTDCVERLDKGFCWQHGIFRCSASPKAYVSFHYQDNVTYFDIILQGMNHDWDLTYIIDGQ